MLENGSFIDEPAPASSFYHIMAAYTQVRETVGVIAPQKTASFNLF